MAFVTAPPIIEQSDFLGGWNPDQEPATASPNTLRSVRNLLPELGGTGALVTRKGFKRVRGPLGATSSHYILNIHTFRGNGESYLMVVVTNGQDAANNVRIYAVKLSDLTVSRVDTAGRNWANPTKPHWGLGIDEIYYGGSPGNDIYSWNPATSTWNASAHIDSSWKTWVDKNFTQSIGNTELANDFAWTGKEVVIYDNKHYAPAESIRYDTWESGQHYKRGDKVSRRTTWSGGSSYWVSFECVKAHEAGSSNDEPGTGSSWKTYWKKVRLPAPVNADNETSSKWYFVPVAPGTSVAAWHAGRLWLRWDGSGDKSRVIFSAPTEPNKGQDVPDVTWDPSDFAPGNDIRGPGGGWLSFNDGKKGGVVEAMRSYGQYLVVFKRQAIWVLSGHSEDSFTVRKLASHVGAVGPDAVDELDGLLYFLSDDGLYVTDGTAVEPVPGFEKFADTLETRIDEMVADGVYDTGLRPQLQAYDDRLFISLPNPTKSTDGGKYWTLVYEPRTGSIWRTDLPVAAMTTARHEKVPRLYFGAPATYGTQSDLIYEYNHEAASDQDDTGQATYAAQDISWSMKTAWWPFSLLRAERRIRRVWAVVRGALTYTLKAYRNWVDTAVKTTTRMVTVQDTTRIEGEWFADSHAVSFELSAPASPATVIGLAVHTEPRRVRYHNV